MSAERVHSEPISRRAEYAETTSRAVVAAARRLFTEKGYFATTVNEIAAAARVSPATVYAVNGGKQGLLRTLIDEWSDAPVVAEAREHIENLNEPGEIVRYLAELTRKMRQEYGDIERYENSPVLTQRDKAALRYTDGLIWTPAHLVADVAAEVRARFSEAEGVELTFDVMRNASNKIAVALAGDAPRVENGTEQYLLDADGQTVFT